MAKSFQLIVVPSFLAALFLQSCAHDFISRSIGEISCGAAAEAMLHAAARTGCPRTRVERADAVLRSDGRIWLIVRLDVCGEKRVYEKRRGAWRDATWRLR
jgi:hypothetical protein